VTNRQARRATARAQRSGRAQDARYWRERNDVTVALLQALVTQAGGKLTIRAEYASGLRKRAVAIKTDLTSDRERIVLTLEPEPTPKEVPNDEAD